MDSSLVPQVSVADSVAKVGDGALLLDVRELHEWNAGHAPDALHIPLDRLRPIVVICRSGRRSDDAAGALMSVGFDAYNVTGGMQAWQGAVHEVVTPSGAPGSVA
jgi:rhodanese-related sulfurtransferase